MINSFLGFTILHSVLFANPTFCDAPDATLTEEEINLVAFIRLGAFSDRGIGALLTQRAISRDVLPESSKKAQVTIPRDIVELLDVRDKNLAAESSELPWPINLDKLAPLDEGKASAEAAIERFRKHGIIELFLNENSKLLDCPITGRKELMDRVDLLTKKIAPALAAAYSRVLTEAEMIVFASEIRSVSVDVDTEILACLSATERARVAKLASYLLPSAIAETKQCNLKLTFGSAVYESYGGAALRRPRTEKR